MLINRRFIMIASILAVIAALSQIVLWLTRPPPLEPTFSGPPRSGYTLDNFSMNALDESGKLSFTISGPRLTRGGADGSIFVSTPDYVIVDKEGNPWIGESDSAWVNKEGSTMKLEGHVVMRRTPDATTQPATITTSDLTAHLRDKTIETAAAAHITQPGSILRGTGLRGDLNSKVLELLSDVHNTFEPTRRKP
ncbi:MAG TPA: LPS export ABC transporter periplasmic protein LptC [Dokdonella sp.]|uniref:LPS export ABC transporter periplasmic protein LptC n=1 Tax=Dokdonella sp. TaxID=2291710 RepID=UPI002D7E15D4|nr:LPS export ABC transporter periplasmic protein LptC [Dokdonella sp.]HET9033344.1 LPS export ABC transporter periplasmic protein LptC [Dokdonella sp.]